MKRVVKSMIAAVLIGITSLGMIPVRTYAATEKAAEPQQTQSWNLLADKLLGGETAIPEIKFSETQILSVLELLGGMMEKEEPMEPLTPEGNLTLVDDYGAKPTSGKQFITVTTKSGAYFYIIIDRDAEGYETVHFLNKVDEADILAYLKEEDAKEFMELQAELEKKKEATKAELESLGQGGGQAPEKEPVDKKPEKKKDELISMDQKSLIVVAAFVVFGIGFLAYTMLIKKKKPEKRVQAEPDDESEWENERYVVEPDTSEDETLGDEE